MSVQAPVSAGGYFRISGIFSYTRAAPGVLPPYALTKYVLGAVAAGPGIIVSANSQPLYVDPVSSSGQFQTTLQSVGISFTYPKVLSVVTAGSETPITTITRVILYDDTAAVVQTAANVASGAILTALNTYLASAGDVLTGTFSGFRLTDSSDCGAAMTCVVPRPV